MLRDANLDDRKQRQDALDHSSKHSIALFNLLDGSDCFTELPEEWQNQAWFWFSDERLMQMRNKGLYLSFNNRRELTTPDEKTSAREASLLVFLCGFVTVELGEYVELDSTWINDMLQCTMTFRQKHLVT